MFGNLRQRYTKLHNCYGKVVRYHPSQVSFIPAAAWKDVYSHKHPQTPKTLACYNDEFATPHIMNVEGPDHARFRKSLSHAFSDKTLRDQESLMKGYLDLLIEKLNGVYFHSFSNIFRAIS